MGAQRRQRGKPQHTGPHLRFSGRAGRRSVRFSLLPFCQTASAFRLICLFHTFFRRGVYRAMVFAPLRCPKLFRFPFALFVGSSFCLFCSSLTLLLFGRYPCICTICAATSAHVISHTMHTLIALIIIQSAYRLNSAYHKK